MYKRYNLQKYGKFSKIGRNFNPIAIKEGGDRLYEPIRFGPGMLRHGLLNSWTSQYDWGNTTGGLETVVSVHNST